MDWDSFGLNQIIFGKAAREELFFSGNARIVTLSILRFA